MSRYVSYRDFDWVLMGFVLMICALGVLQIHSATEHTKFAGAHIKQIYWVLAGVGAMFLVSLLNYQAVLEQIHWMYIVLGAKNSLFLTGVVVLTASGTFMISAACSGTGATMAAAATDNGVGQNASYLVALQIG